MTMKPDHLSRILVAIGLSSLVLLSGCASEPIRTAAPALTESPTPTAIPAPEVAPSSRLGIECDDLLSDAQAEAAIAGAIPRSNQPADLATISYHVFEIFPLIQLGGLACDWSAIGSVSSQTGYPTDYSGVHIEVLPEATGAWSNYVTSGWSNAKPGGSWYCFNRPPQSFCSFENLIGTNWTSIDISGYPEGGATTDENYAAVVRPFVDQIVNVIAGAQTSSEVWHDESASAPPQNCESILPIATVSSTVGVPELLAYPSRDEPKYGLLRTASRFAVNEFDCQWMTGVESGVGGVVLLPSGGWALKRMLPVNSASGPAQPLELPGLGSEDGAWIRCSTPNQTCIVDLLVGGNWAQLSLWADPYSDPYFPADPETAIVALATTAVANLS
jgi:hypothetical protein